MSQHVAKAAGAPQRAPQPKPDIDVLAELRKLLCLATTDELAVFTVEVTQKLADLTTGRADEPDSTIRAKQAAFVAGCTVETIRDWCVRYRIGWRTETGRWLVDPKKLSRHLAGPPRP